MIYRELLQRAIDLASAGETTSVTQLAIEVAAEPQTVQVFSNISKSIANDPYRRSLLRRSNPITFTNGVGTVPAAAMSAYLCESLLTNQSDITQRYSWISQFSELVRASDPRLGYYSANESSIYVIEPLAIYVVGAGLTGSLTLITPCEVVVPTLITDPVVCRDEILDDLIGGMVAALRNS